jgi:hypothetical protein
MKVRPFHLSGAIAAFARPDASEAQKAFENNLAERKTRDQTVVREKEIELRRRAAKAQFDGNEDEARALQASIPTSAMK